MAGVSKLLKDAEERVAHAANAEISKLRAEIVKLRADYEVVKARLNETIKGAVENHTVQILQEYHLLNAETNEPTHWTKQ